MINQEIKRQIHFALWALRDADFEIDNLDNQEGKTAFSLVQMEIDLISAIQSLWAANEIINELMRAEDDDE